jgi:uncharacterized membrane protein
VYRTRVRQLERNYFAQMASNRDPTTKVTQRIDFVRKDENLLESFFARNVTLPKKMISVLNQ